MARAEGTLARHTRDTVMLAARLAWSGRGGLVRAVVAAELHDALKLLPARRLSSLMARGGIRMTSADRRTPQIWHGPAASAAAGLAGLRDKGVLEAVRWHSTGRPGLGATGRRLYVADYCADGRAFREARVGRALARRDFAAAVRYVSSSRLAWLFQQGIRPHPVSLAFWKSLFREVFHA